MRALSGRIDEDAVAGEFGQDDPVVHRHFEVRGLAGLAQERHLVDRGQRVRPSVHAERGHAERDDLERLRALQAVAQAVMAPFVHQEADRAEVHPEHGNGRLAAFQHGMKRLEHEPIAAERDDDVGLLDRHPLAHVGELGLRGTSGRGVGRNQRPPLVPAHPPVTLM